MYLSAYMTANSVVLIQQFTVQTAYVRLQTNMQLVDREKINSITNSNLQKRKVNTANEM